MQTNQKCPPRDESLQQLRRELLEQIVRNEARRRTEQNRSLGVLGKTYESPPGIGGHNG
jgi:hypothetical protein